MKRIALTALAFALSACGGSGTFPNGSVVNSPGGGPTQPPTKLVDVKVTVTVPPHGNRPRMRPNYISVNTASLVIDLSSVDGQGVTGVNPTTINTLTRSPRCKAQTQGLVCTGIASGSPGEDVFAVTTYAGANATGAVLSVGTVQAKIGSGSGGVAISNKLSLSLDGVIAAVKLSLSPDSGKRGTPEKSVVRLVAYDASGAQIVGPSDFASPIGLSIAGDVGHAFMLHEGARSGSSLSITKPPSQITLSYDGDKEASSVSVAASVEGPGSIGRSAGFTLHGKQPPPPVGTIYVLNLGTGGDGLSAVVTEYSGKAHGNAAPVRTLSLSAKLYARTIAVDSSGNLYVGYLDNDLGYDPGTHVPDSGNEIAIYAPGASGNAAPTAVLSSDPKPNVKTELFPIFIAFDPMGRLVTYGATEVDKNTGDAVLTYAAGSSGPAAPEYGFDFVSPGLYYPGPSGLAIDSDNNFYINGALHSVLGNQYGLYVAPAADIDNPDSSPSRTIPWNSKTQLEPGFTSNVSLDSTGEIFIGNFVSQGSGSKTSCQARVNVYAAGVGGGSDGDLPLRVVTLDGASGQGDECDASSNPLLTYFPTIQLYGTSCFIIDVLNNAIDAFSASANKAAKPTLQITGSDTQLSAPVALVVSSLSEQAKARSAHPNALSAQTMKEKAK
jgi:hypothetical protein